MHDYSIDNHPKEKVIFWLVIISIVVSDFINYLIRKVAVSWDFDFSASTLVRISVFGLFTLLFIFFDKSLWKCNFFRKPFLVPDLNGVWVCEGSTEINYATKKKELWNGKINITQSWSKISIVLKTENSESRSLAASITHEKGSGFRLVYQYSNNPNLNEPELQIHKGIVELLFDQNTKKASGHYFTDQHRGTVGSIRLRKK